MIVVTGGAGFIGSGVVWGLNEQGIGDIMVVDALGQSESWRNLVNVRFADYLERDEFAERLEKGELDRKVEGIIHLGACSATTERDNGFLMRNNCRYTLRLAEWSIQRKKRFVYASSAATYGDGSGGFDDDHEKLQQLRPLNGYGFSKYLFDCWALQRGWLERIAGVKYFNVFGPNEYHKGDMRSVVHKAFGQIRRTGKVRLFKSYRQEYRDGWQLRDFVYVKDAVAMTLFLYNRPKVNGIYNVGTGKARSFYDLAAATFAALGKKVNIELIDMPDELRDKYQYFTEARMEKLRGAGYDKACYSLEEAVSDYVKNYLLSDDPYLKV